MVEQAPLYRSDDPDVDAFVESISDHRIAAYKLRKAARTDSYQKNSVPLFLSDHDGEPDPSEYITPPIKKRRASISAKILAAVCAAAAAAVLVALFSSDATRDVIGNVKASMAAVFPAPSIAAQSDPRLIARDRQKDSARPSATVDQTPRVQGVATVGVAPAREEIKMAYQNAVQQARAPAAAPVAEPTPPVPAVHHLDPDAISALLRRADALIASGDVAASRLVLRRAADAGDARAAMALAETYDPAFLEKLGVHGVVPDLAMARSWYEKARTFGSAEAPQRLETLASQRQ
jgi:TPR repeat protein